MPELDDGADDPLFRPELDELELDEPEVDEPELVDPEPDDPELPVPDDEPVDDDPDVEVPEDDVPLLCEPGSARVMIPAAATLARPTVAVVVWIRLRPRARAATARRTLFSLRGVHDMQSAARLLKPALHQFSATYEP